MRHWITSFRLLKTVEEYDSQLARRKEYLQAV